jgi:hypothetical protein
MVLLLLLVRLGLARLPMLLVDFAPGRLGLWGGFLLQMWLPLKPTFTGLFPRVLPLCALG